MFQVLRNAWKITDLRKKILYTLFIILIFRIGSAITIPFIDAAAIANAVNSSNTGFEFLTLMSGGGFSNGSIFALSITPYINASIIIQLLTVAIPPLERMAKDGEAGRKKLGQITRLELGRIPQTQCFRPAGKLLIVGTGQRGEGGEIGSAPLLDGLALLGKLHIQHF